MTRPRVRSLAQRGLVAILCVAVLSPVALACYWDIDAFRDERAQTPGTLELIAGKFPRHSREYYAWRIEDRTARLNLDPDNLDLLDDLAVAHDKLGNHDLAIETILRKQAIKPGEYKTFANLGTFHIHNGQFAEGAEFIRKAIEINPSAHFGREIYQFLLVAYVQESSVNGGRPSLPIRAARDVDGPADFSEWIEQVKDNLAVYELGDLSEQTAVHVQNAQQGIEGMMRFGNYDSPILLEVLGDLLFAQRYDFQAARAYLRAALQVEATGNVDAGREYRKLALAAADRALTSDVDEHRVLADIETALNSEIADAERWFARLRADEMRWIADGEDVDERFAQTYFNAQPTTPEPNMPDPRQVMEIAAIIIVAVLAAIIVAVIALIVYFFRKRRRQAIA